MNEMTSTQGATDAKPADEIDASSTNITVSLSGPGVSITRKVDQVQLLAVLRIILSTGAQVAGVDTRGSRVNTSTPILDVGRPDVSLAEFLREVAPRRNPDKIVTIAFYSQRYLGAASFAAEEIRPKFRLAGEALPGNFARDFRWAVSNGWLAEVHGEPGSFYVTRSGEQAVTSGFPDQVTRATKVAKVGRRRRRPGNSAQPAEDSSEG